MGDEETHPTDKILTAIRTIVTESGPDAVTYRAIAQLTGLSVGTVGYYFGSRGDLLEAALEPHHSRVADIVSPLLGTADFTAERAARVVEDLTRYAFDHRPDIRLRMVAWIIDWQLPPSRMHLVTTLLRRAVRLRWNASWTETERRVIVQAVVYAAQRFAAMRDDELVALLDAESAADARDAVVHCLGRLCTVLVGGKLPEPQP
ncbi:MAG: helix-turn-helix domain-containing protein [Myxococcota bacterium]